MTAILFLLFAVALWLGVCMLLALGLEWFWSAVAVAAFGAPTLTYWQCWGVCVVLTLLIRWLRPSTQESSR